MLKRGELKYRYISSSDLKRGKKCQRIEVTVVCPINKSDGPIGGGFR